MLLTTLNEKRNQTSQRCKTIMSFDQLLEGYFILLSNVKIVILPVLVKDEIALFSVKNMNWDLSLSNLKWPSFGPEIKPIVSELN